MLKTAANKDEALKKLALLRGSLVCQRFHFDNTRILHSHCKNAFCFREFAGFLPLLHSQRRNLSFRMLVSRNVLTISELLMANDAKVFIIRVYESFLRSKNNGWRSGFSLMIF